MSKETTDFNPPISKRNTLKLIDIAYYSDSWQAIAIEQAKTELENRGVTQEYIKSVVDGWEKSKKQLERQREEQLKKNESKSYLKIEMIFIFLFAPYLTFGTLFDKSLVDLKRKNYKTMLKQRIFLLIGGTTFWIFVIIIKFST